MTDEQQKSGKSGLLVARNSGPMILEDGKVGRDITADYNDFQYHEDEDFSVRKAKMEMWIARALGIVLTKTYPNRQWGVTVDTGGGVVIILCPSLSIKKGYVLHLKDDSIKNLEKRAIRAAGEILERHGITRARRFDTDILETLDRDNREEVVTDDSEPEPI